MRGIREILGVDVPFYRVDAADEAGLRRVFETEKGIQGVIHFAASKAVGESVAKPLHYYRNNLGSLLSLLP